MFAGDRPHECEICQKRFALACNLRAHMKTHEEPQNEKCLRCGREYPINTGLVTLGCCHECYISNQAIPLLRQKWALVESVIINCHRIKSNFKPYPCISKQYFPDYVVQWIFSIWTICLTFHRWFAWSEDRTKANIDILYHIIGKVVRELPKGIPLAPVLVK